MPVAQYLIALLLMLLPYRMITALFNRALGIKAFPPVHFYFSGRVALYRMALACKSHTTVAFLPDYTCNVVHKAFQTAGISTLTYPTDEYFEPSIHDLQPLVQNHPSALLCLTPMMGANGGQSWIFSAEGRAWRAQHRIILFMDLSQDIFRLEQLSAADMGPNTVLMASFNDKAFPGVMGAVVFSDRVDPCYTPPPSSEKRAILKLLIKKSVRRLVRRLSRPDHTGSASNTDQPRFDYSYCQHFPYTFAHSGASPLQVAVATVGVWFSPYYQWCKQQYLKKGLITPEKTPFYRSAPYVRVRSPAQQLRKKSPYAHEDDPENSARPDLLCYHFKGFDDTL